MLTVVTVLLAGCASLGLESDLEPIAAPLTGPGSLPASEDADQDGVPDGADVCEDTLFAIGVADDGCSPFFGTLEGVVFRPGKAQLGSAARAALDPLLEAMRAHPEVAVELQGHTDNRGRAGENLVLSKRRVMAVVRYLVAGGIAASRITPIAFGESRPIQKNATPEGRASNRRIEVRAVAP